MRRCLLRLFIESVRNVRFSTKRSALLNASTMLNSISVFFKTLRKLCFEQFKMNPKALQYIMGHANITMTLNYYAHATYDSAKAEIILCIIKSHICIA